MNVPEEVETAVETAAQAYAAWGACPVDRDHEDRHAKADAFRRAKADLDQAVTHWVSDLAAAR